MVGIASDALDTKKPAAAGLSRPRRPSRHGL
jgi:hypothetical protein